MEKQKRIDAIEKIIESTQLKHGVKLVHFDRKDNSNLNHDIATAIEEAIGVDEVIVESFVDYYIPNYYIPNIGWEIVGYETTKKKLGKAISNNELIINIDGGE